MVPKHVSLGSDCFNYNIEPPPSNQEPSKLAFCSLGFNVGTVHRLLLAGFYASIFYYDWHKLDPNEFGNAALRGGGLVTASSSWLPLYPTENAILNEQFITGEGTELNPLLQSSWCANSNKTGEWI